MCVCLFVLGSENWESRKRLSVEWWVEFNGCVGGAFKHGEVTIRERGGRGEVGGRGNRLGSMALSLSSFSKLVLLRE